MNKVKEIQMDYFIDASRTLETILLINEKNNTKVLYLYNYQGYHYRIFENIFEVGNFFKNEPFTLLKEYSSGKQVDKFLESYEFVH